MHLLGVMSTVHTHRRSWLLLSLPPFLTQSICPTEVQKVAGVTLLTTHQPKKKRIHNPPSSFSTTESFLSAPWMTIDVLHVPNIRHVAFSKTNDMVSSLRRAHLLTLTLVLVFFPLHIYMESVLCLCSVLFCGGFLSLCLKETSNRARGAHDGLNMIEVVIFCSLTLSLASALIFLFSFFVWWKTSWDRKKENWHACHQFSLLHLLTCMSTACWLVISSDVEGVYLYLVLV